MLARDKLIGDKTLICVGRISGPQGLKGEVRLKSYTDIPDAILGYSPLQTKSGAQITITRLRPVKDGFAARIEGIDDRTAAENLSKTELFVTRDRLPKPEEEEYYNADLTGLEVRSEEGDVMGSIRAVQDFGGGPLLEIFQPGARDTALVSFTTEMVPVVDISGGFVVIVKAALEEG